MSDGINIKRDDEHLPDGSGRKDTGTEVTAAPPDRYLRLAQEAYDESSDYWEANFYRTWMHSLSNFRGRHPAGSKYHSASYAHRSRIFRPKTRAAVRRGEAACTMAFFSTDDAVVIRPEDERDELNVVAAEIRKELLDFHLNSPDRRYGLPWFQTVLGAYQDTEVMGAVCSCQEWLYEDTTIRRMEPAMGPDGMQILDGETGEPAMDEVIERRVLKDRPDSRIVPLENVRFHPAADWADPVNSSPFFIELMPFYVHEVKEKMESGEWFFYSNIEIAQARKDNYDSVRQERDGRERRDPYEDTNSLGDYSVVWVHRNILRVNGKDVVYHTLGTYIRLDDPKPIEEVWPHGERPYVIGTCMIEAHRIMPSAPVELSHGLQAMANEIVNSRFDNVRLALNKRYFVQRNAGVDMNALQASAPGSGVMMDDVNAVLPEQMTDVTASGYNEQDRVNVDFDDIMGSFSSGSIQSNRKLNETVGGLNLLSQDANTVSEYQLRVFAETWVERVINQLDKLIMFYESDARVVQIAGNRSKAWRRIKQQYLQEYGQAPQVDMDQVASAGVEVKVSVGFGATNPQGRIEKLMLGMNVVASAAPGALQRIKEDDLVNEVFGILGWQSGARFFEQDESQPDPRMQQMQKRLQELEQEVATEMHKAKAKAEGEIAVQKARGETELQKTKMDGQSRLSQAMISAAAQRFGHQVSARGKVADVMLDRAKFALERDRFRREGVQQEFENEGMALERETMKRDHTREDTLLSSVANIEQSAMAAADAFARLQAMDSAIQALQKTGLSGSEVARELAASVDALSAELEGMAEDMSSVADRADGMADMAAQLQGNNDANEARRQMIEQWLRDHGSPGITALLDRVQRTSEGQPASE